MLSIKVGDLTLVDSGSIIVPEGLPVHFFIKDLEYIFTFSDDEKGKPHTNIISNTGNKLEIELVNFNDIVGVGNITPLSMGRIDGRELLLMLRVSMLKEGGKTILYSWYLRENTNSNAENNG